MKPLKKNTHYVLGIDFGTDSVRSIIVDAADGNEIASEVIYYPRWKAGKYCDPLKNQFRQHPLDYIESLTDSIRGALAKSPEGTAQKIKGLSVDTTGSTPCAIDKQGIPLALTPGFEDNPNAMFVLWKDHTAVKEAEEINRAAKSWDEEDYTKFEGGVYSSEWFWSKILHVLRQDKKVRDSAFSWVEHCDWIPAMLIGSTDPLKMKRSRTAAGHKAMWHVSWGGLPPNDFLIRIDPLLNGLRERLYSESVTGNETVGQLTSEWAEKLGLHTDVTVGVGSFDAHFGAVGAEIEPNILVKIVGTSTCDMIMIPMPDGKEKEHLVKGICGQVDGSVMPGMLGLEAGQSAVGDIYAWFKNMLMWPIENLLGKESNLDEQTRNRMIEEISGKIIPELSRQAAQIPINESGIVALDWMNGRRTPFANQTLRGVIAGLNLGSDAPRIFRALVEATAFGAKKIVDRFIEEGVDIHGVIAIGGIPKKSPFVMQVTADILNMPIKIAASEQACALGSAMAAATASGLYASMEEAQKAMGSGFEKVYKPDEENAKTYQSIYEKYNRLAKFIEDEFTS